MRVLLLSHYFEPENSAPQRRWSAFIARWVAAGHEVAVFCPPPHYLRGVLEPQHRSLRSGTVGPGAGGARVYRVAFVPHGRGIVSRTVDHLVAAISTHRHVRRAVARGEVAPEVIIATAPAVPTLLAGALLAKRLGIPFVAEMRDAWPDLVSHTPGLQGGRGLVGLLKRRIHESVTRWQQSAQLVVTTTSTFATVLRERGIDDVLVVRNGVDPDRYAALPPRDAAHEPLRVLYMGNMGRSQGLETVVRAVAALRADGVSIEARFVGYGADVARLTKLNRRLGGHVEIRGPIPASEVSTHYAWADSIIVSLRAWEPMQWTIPSKLFDALASGRHVTGLLAGEAAALLADSGGGTVVAPGDRDGLVAAWSRLAQDRSGLDVEAQSIPWVRANASHEELAHAYADALSRVVAEWGGVTRP